MKKFILSILILTSTSLYAQCEGDLNGDGIKNILDIVALVNEVISGDTECEEESVHGCLDSQACNYDPTAMIDNNSCYYCYNDDCDTYPEDEYDCDGNCVDSDGDDICDNVDDCVGTSGGYDCGDLEVLGDFWSINGFGECSGEQCANYNDYCENTYNNTEIIWDNGRITELSLSYCALYFLPESIGSLTNLEYLSIDGETNYFTTIPESIGNLINLEHLSIQGSNVQSLPTSIANLTSLYTLDLSFNGIASIPDSFSNLNNLGNLYLNNNQLTTISENIISGLISLENLSLYRNELTSIPENICELNLASGGSGLPYIALWGNKLCEEYRYDCFTSDSFDYIEGQDQSNCCEGPNGEPNWTTCP